MQKLIRYSLILLGIFTAFIAVSQDEGYIYGTVTTIDNDRYTGPIRWGKEEVFWTDIFNASKEDNENLKYLSRDVIAELKDQKRGFWGDLNSLWYQWENDDFLHQFACQFGEIKRIEVTRRNGAAVTLQNGQTVEVNGSGYNDIGTDVKIYDQELGIVNIDWDRIEVIEFLKTPKKLDLKYGEPLYGQVETSEGMFEGFIQWDHDERLSEDKLDGDTEDGDVSIQFGNIKSIERAGSSRSNVILKSGRELMLSGSNDVNDSNRGIIVTIEGLGRVDVPWDEFDKVTFTDIRKSGPAYTSFVNQNPLRAKLESKEGEIFEGLLAFDLDERYDYEILQGKLGDIEFLIPFKNILEITPRNYSYASVLLKNGKKYLLGESQDVSEKNSGMLVKTSDTYTYIKYRSVERITF
ncbi:MAG: hypothetical protein RIA69_17460 [Cyclobacteriaceae bacterium]